MLFCIFTPAISSPSTDDPESMFEVVAELQQGPGNITVTNTGDIIVSLHQFFDHTIRVARIEDDGSLVEFAADARLDSVLGLQAEGNGVVWLLDNAMRGKGLRRLVGWHASEDRETADIDLSDVIGGVELSGDITRLS
jgi:hypothetical protein